ncbi:MAG: ATP-grasp domain-containing protein, partial [Cloacibacterium normanense]|nr:ATP-grasp domain-containing protein [Cloacibacterium normanense]
LQGYWNAIGQKYTGCDFYKSALTFNKKDTLAVLAKYGIPSAKSFYLRKGENINEEKIVEELGLPLFVKPNQSGSSLGISKVKAKSELAAAIEFAFKEDDEILIESFLNGMEVSVGVIDYKGETIVLGITEIVPHKEFFDYEAKYEGASEEITPARLDEETRYKVEKIAKHAYESLGMSGFSRSEYIIMDGTPYMLEMNTNPGFSPASILPQQAKIYGISIKDLCGNEVEKALAK